MHSFKDIKKYPIMILFFVFLAVFTIADFVKPDAERSEYENRKLEQQPEFSWEAFLGNQWTQAYGEYIRDQFLFRDGWVGTQRAMETIQGKLEVSGVWFARDGYQIVKNDSWTTAQDNFFPANVDAVSSMAQNHPGKVWMMLVPSAANVMSDRLPWNPHQIDENEYINNAFAQMREAGVQVIDLREQFFVHEGYDEQLYYRTDHHWTTEGGAFLAYELFCNATGQEVAPPSSDARVAVPEFLGTNYSKTRRIGTKPDELVYYDLPNTMTVYNIEQSGETSETQTGLMDKAKLDEYDKYAAFLHGNNGYSVIEGNGEGRILVIKDSYANCFIPYLIENYGTIGVIDPRTWPESNIQETIAADGYDEFLILFNFNSFSEDKFLRQIASA